MQTRTCFLSLSIILVGCVADVHESDHVDELSDVDEFVAELKGANLGRGSAAVYVQLSTQSSGGRVGHCSGVIVNPHVLLLSSHCIGNLKNDGPLLPGDYYEGSIYLKVKGFPMSGSAVCHSSSNCSSRALFSYKRMDHKSHGSGSDIAYVYRSATWSNNPKYAGLYTGSLSHGEDYRIYGAGLAGTRGFVGAMRYVDSRLDWVSSTYVITEARGKRHATCDGDSGAPLFRGLGPYVMGIHAQSDKPQGEVCARSTWRQPAKMRAYRVRQNTVDWVNYVLGLLSSNPNPRCRRVNGSHRWWCAYESARAPASERERCTNNCANILVADPLYGHAAFEACMDECPQQ